MDVVKKEESHMTSAAAFVEGGIQESCDDSCSICLEAFCDSDPSTVTSCKHEFHLQCVLEWCQRSSNCPMCWRPISLKDPTSQELLEAVERERSIRLAPSRNMAIFHHPTLGDFELQHLPVGVDDPELEERIIQHLAAAAAMGRTHRIARREGSRIRPSANTRPQPMVFSANPDSSSTGGPNSFHVAPSEVATETNAIGTDASISIENQHHPPSTVQNNVILTSSASGFQVIPNAHLEVSNDNRSHAPNLDSAGPSEYQPPADNWKSRLNSLSIKYKESLSRNTRGWKEKLFSRSSSMAEIGSEVKRELNAGIATVSRMMERLETRDNRSAGDVSSANFAVNTSTIERSGNGDNVEETSRELPLNGNGSANSVPSSANS